MGLSTVKSQSLDSPFPMNFLVLHIETGLSLRAVTCNTPVTAELSGCYGCCKSPLYIVLSAYS